jgi:hypothetical protein
MSKKKDTTKKLTAKERRAKLARNILAVINNPACPSELYNAIVCELSDMENHAQILARISATPKYLEELISRFKGGAR